MANDKKYIDRTPHIRAAGFTQKNTENTVESCFREYNIAEIDENLIKKKETEKFTYKLPLVAKSNRSGSNTIIKNLLSPPIKTDYQIVEEELQQTFYSSFWNRPVGRSRDQIPGLPRGLDPVQTTFGAPTNRCELLKDIVNPQKSHDQVCAEYDVGHENYKLSHNNYYPGEKLSRNYPSAHFDDTTRFGKYKFYDPRGVFGWCCCHWFNNEAVSCANRIQADFVKRTHPMLGKSLMPNNNISSLPEGYAFGKKLQQDSYSVGDLLRNMDAPKCQCKSQLFAWLKSFNTFKFCLQSMCNKFFTFNEFERYLTTLITDSNKTSETISVECFYQACRKFGIPFDTDLVAFLKRLSLVDANDNLQFKLLLKILNSRESESIHLAKMDDLPVQNKYYLTSNQAATCDYLVIDNSSSCVAGISSIRSDLAIPRKPQNGIKTDVENLSDETTVSLLVNPPIHVNFGLSGRDFHVPRSASVLRALFAKMEQKFTDEKFGRLWDKCVSIDKTGCLVCVATFNQCLQDDQTSSTNK